jgi:hypothetical protein
MPSGAPIQYKGFGPKSRSGCLVSTSIATILCIQAAVLVVQNNGIMEEAWSYRMVFSSSSVFAFELIYS